MSFPINLPFLSDREAIEDVIYRCMLSVDAADEKLFDSSLLPNATIEFNGSEVSGIQNIRRALFEKISKLDCTHHVSNIRINSSGNTASVTASVLAQHYREGEGNISNTQSLLSGGLNFFEVAKDDIDDLWRVKSWKVKTIWSEGDPTIVS
ncbi:hypothetical protein ZYGR_0BQ00130 [Zygosaccharomyces rouxii]|uniref:SnoaL-like domain-containing protein n=1 Tax=Zygosaccharomyces rouxii TaxID=4956 RepID=A0A1Q3AL96_ZYGRO|nr:hypothetical protein ZYGR_0BQ00130 [Zygosaccharomyces rouxii]